MTTIEKLNSIQKSNGNLRGVKLFRDDSTTNHEELQGWPVYVGGVWKFALYVDKAEILFSQSALQRILGVVEDNNSEA